MHLYWTSIFILPTRILQDIDCMMLRFLWYGHGPRKCIFKSWEDTCRSKEEGGLGIQRASVCNQAGVLRLLWELETNKNALWVKWIWGKYLRGSSIWCARPPQNASWVWRSILKIRPLAEKLIYYSIGNGRNTSFFLDPWLGSTTIHNCVGDRLR